MAYFLGTLSLALTLALLGAACNTDTMHCEGDCPCFVECSCNDGSTQFLPCGGAGCTDGCSDHGGAVDGGDGG